MQPDRAELSHTRNWSATRPTLLLVDDDRDFVDLLTYSLERAGMDVSAAFDGAAALHQFEVWQPDLILLEIIADGTARLDVLTSLRRLSEVPIIVVTGARSLDDKVRAFELGADDYVTKPFSHSELIARIGVQLRLAGHAWYAAECDPEYLRVGPLTLDMTQHLVSIDERSVALTRMEFRLLAYLMTRPNQIVPVDAILSSLWPRGDSNGKATLQVLVHRLRHKLEDDPSQPSLMQTVPGLGLRLTCPQSAQGD
jgi:DNA-binding response OmpR family regulator